jgi:hypothetical protein
VPCPVVLLLPCGYLVKKDSGAHEVHGEAKTHLASIEEEAKTAEASCEGEPAESYLIQNVEQEQETPGDSASNALEAGDDGSYFPWKEELESLVRGGVLMAFF